MIKNKKRILIYQIHGLSHGGTEKNLQLIANSLADDYEVFFMYGTDGSQESRGALLDSRIHLVPFTYSNNEIAVPHKLYGMKPHIKEVIAEYSINLIITASPGYAHYPWNVITDVPIILSNVFGAPSLQKNIVRTIFMSETVRKHSEAWTGPQPGTLVRYLSLNTEPPENYLELGKSLREKLHIPAGDFVFGRIGRDSDAIFDPIAINAWKQIADKHPNTHFLVMSPPPALKQLVETEQIPRVHFLPPSSAEEAVWAFHAAIDCMAHFRKDGETSGVAIAESLCVGNPVISHRSSIWNAHLEYLKESCARIANIDTVEEYAQFMEEFIALHANEPERWQTLRNSALQVGTANFSPQTYREFITGVVSDVLS